LIFKGAAIDMPIGYVLSVKDVLDYYSRADISEAICRAARGRKSHITDRPQDLGGAKPNIPELSQSVQIPEEAKQFLQDYSPDDIPRNYPAFHSVVSRDIVLEVDVKHDHREAFGRGRKALDVLNSYGVPYRVKFSGNSSPHIIIPEEVYQPLVPEEKAEEYFKKLHSFVVRACSDAGVDSSFSDPNHFLRLPYSLNENTGLVSTPVKPQDYDSFQLEMAEIGTVQVADWWFDTGDLLSKEDNMQLLLEQALKEG
jgi:hypothetical protein